MMFLNSTLFAFAVLILFMIAKHTSTIKTTIIITEAILNMALIVNNWLWIPEDFAISILDIRPASAAVYPFDTK